MRKVVCIAMYSNYDCCNSTDDPCEKEETYLSEVYKRINRGVRRQDFSNEFYAGAYGGSMFYFMFATDDENIVEKSEESAFVIIPKGTQFGFMSRFQGSSSFFEAVTYRKFKLALDGKTKYDRINLEVDQSMSYNLADIFGDDDWIEEQDVELL